MVLFTKEFISAYRNDPGMKQMLGGVVLLNRDEFFDWYIEELRKTTRPIAIPKKYIDGGVGSPPAWFTREVPKGAEPYRPSLVRPPPGFVPNAPGFGTGPPKAPVRPPQNATTRRGKYPSRRRTSRATRTTKDVFRFIKEADRIKTEQLKQLTAIANETFKEIAEETCSNIGYEYGRAALINITRYYEFDFLVAVTPDYDKQPPMLNYKKQREYKRKKILGFLIAERGECGLKPNTYSVNLICVQQRPVVVGGKQYSVKGTILLGAFLYCIKCYDGRLEELEEGEDPLPVDQQGVLELAGSYRNLNGFFAYSKLGFKKDISLLTHMHIPKSERCFYSKELLPMIAHMSQFDSPLHVIQRVTGARRMTLDELVANDDTGLIRTGLPDTIPMNEDQKNLQIKIAEDAKTRYELETEIHLGNVFDEEDIDFNRAVMKDIFKRMQIDLNTYMRSRSGELDPSLQNLQNSAYSTETESSSSNSSLDSVYKEYKKRKKRTMKARSNRKKTKTSRP